MLVGGQVGNAHVHNVYTVFHRLSMNRQNVLYSTNNLDFSCWHISLALSRADRINYKSASEVRSPYISGASIYVQHVRVKVRVAGPYCFIQLFSVLEQCVVSTALVQLALQVHPRRANARLHGVDS
eukprot:COSAG02_NODE_9307_length_2260_cov_2.597711_3_plen_126_part_00